MFDREIDELAHAILADYKPDLLREPGKINLEHFLEHYLGANVQFHDIYNDDPEHPILALTTFTEGSVNVFNREKECVSSIVVPARTIIIDNEVMDQGNEGFALFSGLHEGGHLTLHWNVFVDDNGIAHGRKEATAYGRKDDTASVICCRRENIENYGFTKKERSPADWREHQADYYAAAIAMPNATFIPFVHQFFRDNEVYKGHIKMGYNPDLDILAHDLLPEYISEVYGVSRRAARIKLRKCGIVSGGETQRNSGNFRR